MLPVQFSRTVKYIAYPIHSHSVPQVSSKSDHSVYTIQMTLSLSSLYLCASCSELSPSSSAFVIRAYTFLIWNVFLDLKTRKISICAWRKHAVIELLCSRAVFVDGHLISFFIKLQRSEFAKVTQCSRHLFCLNAWMRIYMFICICSRESLWIFSLIDLCCRENEFRNHALHVAWWCRFARILFGACDCWSWAWIFFSEFIFSDQPNRGLLEAFWTFYLSVQLIGGILFLCVLPHQLIFSFLLGVLL